jgi:hypothetical protein
VWIKKTPRAAKPDRTAAKGRKDDGSLGDAEELAGNPAILSIRRRTGGFASPSFDGYALVKRCSFVLVAHLLSPPSRPRPVEPVIFEVPIEQNFVVEAE